MGKARVFGSFVEEEIGLLRNKVAGYALDRNPPNAVGTTYLTSQVGLTPIEQSGLQIDRTKMPRTGGVFIGAIGFEIGTCRLITGTNTCNLLLDGSGAQSTNLFGDYDISLDTGTTGTLTTLLGARMDGMRVRLHGIQGNTITITHTAAATDNTITCPDDTNATLTDDEVIDLVYDISTSKWRLIGGGGGGDTITFPITPTVDDREDTWSGTQNIDLSNTKAHVTKFKLDQNLTITLSNIPADETQIEFEIELLQDATGGRTVTFPTEVVEDITISSDANTLTIVTLRVNDGANVHAITTLAGTIAGGTAFLPISGGTMTGAIVMGADTDIATFDITNLDRLLFTPDSGAFAAGTDIGILADASGDMILNVADLDKFFLSIDKVLEYSFDQTEANFGAKILQNTGDIIPASGSDIGDPANLFTDVWASRVRFTTAVSIDFISNTITINGGTGVSVDMRSNNSTQMQLLSGGGIDIFTNMNFSSGNIDLNAGNLTIGVTAATGAEINLLKFAKIRWLDNAGTGNVQMNMDTLDNLNLSNSAGTASMFLQGFYSMFESADPTTVEDIGYLYTKNVSGDTHLFYDNFTESPLDISISTATKFADDVFDIHDNTTPTKILQFTLASLTAGTNFMSVLTTTAVRTWSLPDITGTFAMLQGTQTFSGAKTFSTTATFTGAANFNSAVNLGNDAGDSISMIGRVDTDIIPIDALQNLGSTALPWNNIVSDNTLFCSNLKVFDTDSDINVFNDLDMQAGVTIDFNDTSTSAGAGSSGDVPSQVQGYVQIKVQGVVRKVPFYNA